MPPIISSQGTTHPVLTQDRPRPFSVLAGWRHGARAFIATQMNHGGMPQLSLSMVYRASLIQSLIARGVREIVFLDGCAGGALRMLWPRLAHRIFRDEPAPLRWRPQSWNA